MRELQFKLNQLKKEIDSYLENKSQPALQGDSHYEMLREESSELRDQIIEQDKLKPVSLKDSL